MVKNIRIWAKMIKDGKIVKDIVFSGEPFFDEDSFHERLRDICDKLDIATPVVLPQHFVNFVRFHNCRFYEHDFVESFPYDRLVLEDCKD